MVERQIVNPWEVRGDIDYGKVLKEFGISAMENLPPVFNENVLFRRKIVFGHRDIQRILETVKHKKKFVVMSGLMPTGKFHIGHMLLAQQFLFWQNLGAKIYIAVADVEAHNARAKSFIDSRKIAIEEYVKSYIALGLKPKNCEIYFQSERSKSSVKSNAYYRLQNVLSNHATFNEVKAIYGDITPGKMFASFLQAADMLHPQLKDFEGELPVLVPVGIDQDPHLRMARDVARRVKEYRFLPLSSTYHLFAPGLGGGKMSSSDPNSFIALSDSYDVVKKKINKYAYSGGQATLEEHKKYGGNPDIDVSFQYLKMFFESDDKKLMGIENSYRNGAITTGELKGITIDKINNFLKDFQKKKTAAGKYVEKFLG